MIKMVSLIFDSMKNCNISFKITIDPLAILTEMFVNSVKNLFFPLSTIASKVQIKFRSHGQMSPVIGKGLGFSSRLSAWRVASGRMTD